MTFNCTIGSGATVSSAFHFTRGDVGALAVMAPSGAVGPVRIDFGLTSVGPWFTYASPAGTPYTIVASQNQVGVLGPPAALGSWFRLTAGVQVQTTSFVAFTAVG